MLTPEMAERFAAIALGHVRREYPYKPGIVLTGPDDLRPPRAVHPIFHGSFDWHSCVHGYWMLARILNRFPDLPVAGNIRALFDAQLTAEKVAGECAFLATPAARGFERPYGWAWLLKLAAELKGGESRHYSDALAPLAAVFAARFRDFLPLASYPVRVGTHFNTAFALRLAADFAEATDDGALTGLLTETARRWYADDRDCPAWGEPGGDDFLSPTLIVAEAMRRLLPASEFREWFAAYLPGINAGHPSTLFTPARVSDRSDGKIAHLDGLSLSRAWCWRALATALPEDDPRRSVMTAAARLHLGAGLPHVAGDYMGEHWLATFAVLAMDEA